jgi:hypothetical protein
VLVPLGGMVISKKGGSFEEIVIHFGEFAGFR